MGSISSSNEETCGVAAKHSLLWWSSWAFGASQQNTLWISPFVSVCECAAETGLT